MRQTLTRPLPGTVEDPRYPDSDGRPMGDTDYHSIALVFLREALEDFFASWPDVYIGMNLIFYYEEGNPKARRDPDILVAKGVGKHRRRSYRIWEEKKLPRVLFEVVSKKTKRVDLEDKRLLYEQLRIPEYFLFDPEGKYMKPRLRGFRLHKGDYVELTPAADGSLISKELGLRLVPEGEMLRLIDLQTGQPILTRQEQAVQAKEEVVQAKEEVVQAKEEVVQAKEEALQAREQALQAREQAERQSRHAAELEAELERLRKLLENGRKSKNGET